MKNKINEKSIVRYMVFDDVNFVVSVLLGFTQITQGDKIYRGQGLYCEWEVLPSILRDNTFVKSDESLQAFAQIFFNLEYKKAYDSEYLLRVAEMNQIQRAYNTTSSKGLEAPTSEFLDCYLHQSIFSKMGGSLEVLEKNWPLPETVQFISYLQHLGLKTRMLDFTYDFATALYFALKQAMYNGSFGEKDCEVIMLDMKIFDEMDSDDFDHKVQFTKPTGKYNPNSILQNGLLMYFNEPSLEGENIPFAEYEINRLDYIDRLDNMIQEYLASLTEEEYIKKDSPIAFSEYMDDFEPIIVKINIKHDIHIEIFEILQKMRRSGKYLFSGMDSVRMEHEEQTYISSINNSNFCDDVDAGKYYVERDANGMMLTSGKYK